MKWAAGPWAAAAVVAALSGAATAATAPDPSTPVDYVVAPVLQPQGLVALAVEVRFRADPSGRTLLELPSRTGDDREPWRWIDGLSVTNAAVEETGPSERALISAPGAPLVVRYTVRSAYPADPTALDVNPYRPIIRPRWFEVLGERVFAWPRGRSPDPVRFHWGAFPAGWRLASNLEHETAQTVATARNSVLLGGTDLRIISRRVAGSDVRLAYRGTWTFTPDAFERDLARIVEAEGQFWNDPGGPLLVALVPLVPAAGRTASGGRGFSESFTLYATASAARSDFTHLIAHEHTHQWLPAKLGGLPKTDEALDYWFSEGFTDFYAARLLLRSGVWTPQDFVDEENQTLLRYAASSERNAPNRRIGQAYWSDRVVQQLPYQRGRLLAALWDYDLQTRLTGRASLDDLLRRQRDEVRGPSAGAASSSAAARFVEVARRAGVDLTSDLHTFVDEGATLSLPADLYGVCAAVRQVSLPTFDLGFDAAKSRETGIVSGVKPDGPAYAAGLRDGMARVGREGGAPSDPRVAVTYIVRGRDGELQPIRYLPAGRDTLSIQEIVLAPALPPDRQRRCARVLAGLESPRQPALVARR